MVPGATASPTDGLARHVYEISRRMGASGLRVVGVGPGGRGRPGSGVVENSYGLVEVRVPDVHIPRLPSATLGVYANWAVYYARYRTALRRILETAREPLIVHTHGFYTLAQPGDGRGGRRWCARVATLHGFVQLDTMLREGSPVKAGFLDGILRRVYRRADRYTTFSERMKRLSVRLYGLDESSVEVIPHGVDGRFFSRPVAGGDAASELRRRYAIEDGQRMVLFVGSLDRLKRLDVLIDAFKVLAERRRDALLVLCGSWGDYLPGAEERVARLGLAGRTRFIKDRMSKDALRVLYQSSALYYGVNQFVTAYSTALLEAMASGVPPVVYGRSSAVDVVDDSCGLVLDRLEPSEMAERMDSLLGDEGLAARLGGRSMRRMLEGYDWDNVVVPRYLSLYRGISVA